MNDNILLVTGASSDVGSELIKRVIHNYGKVLCHYRNSGLKMEELLTQFSGKVVPLQADLSDYMQTIELAEKISQYNITHFVHLPASAAAVNTRFSKADWDGCFQKDIDISLRPAVILCQTLFPQMIKRKYGKIVFMLTSFVTSNPTPAFSSAYMTVKSSLLGLMKALSAEFSGKGITVNGVSPSMTDTKFLDAVSDLAKELNANKSPIKRLLTIDDVVPVFEFLLSPGADNITGQNIAVTAGG